MPVRKTKDGKWTFGGAKYDTKAAAEPGLSCVPCEETWQEGQEVIVVDAWEG